MKVYTICMRCCCTQNRKSALLSNSLLYRHFFLWLEFFWGNRKPNQKNNDSAVFLKPGFFGKIRIFKPDNINCYGKCRISIVRRILLLLRRQRRGYRTVVGHFTADCPFSPLKATPLWLSQPNFYYLKQCRSHARNADALFCRSLSLDLALFVVHIWSKASWLIIKKTLY